MNTSTDIHEEASVKTKEQDDYGTAQTSIRHHPQQRSAMKEYAVAPIHTSGVALRHVGSPGCNLCPALDLDIKPPEPGCPHLPAIASSLCLALRQGTITVAWRSGVRLCRRANGQGISRLTVCQWCIGPRDTVVLRGHVFSTIGHRSYASKNAL